VPLALPYGPNFPDLFRRAGDHVGVEQPTKFDLVINLNTAETFGLTISPALLGRADEVIE
jgi:putative ABC transport system substrate-binding protein